MLARNLELVFITIIVGVGIIKTWSKIHAVKFRFYALMIMIFTIFGFNKQIIMNRIYIVFFILLLSFSAKATDFEKLLRKKIPNIISITKLETKDHFAEEYEILLKQNIDHNNSNVGSFQQRIFLSHFDRKKPMLIVTEGYNARQRTYELARILRSNQLIVEYRYFGKSKPQKMDWKYLKNDQAMEDLHTIRKLFGKIYKKKWVSTGISKGGTTCLMYKAKYPKDVKVAVPYVAPLAIAQEDRRTDQHILSMGTKLCRDKLTDFQRSALEKRDEIIPMLKDFASLNGMQYTYVSYEKALDYAVSEFTFSFWQWGYTCDMIPENPSAKAIFDLINQVVSFDFYSDATCQLYLPAFYQFVTENGYYGFITNHIDDLLKAEPNPNNLMFAPQNTDLTFIPYCQNVIDFLDEKGDKIIYIYGEVDTWTACGYTPKSDIKALRMTKKGGAHTTRIASFDDDERAIIYDTLHKWLRMKINRL